MKYYKWNILDDDIIVIREPRKGAYEPYFDKIRGFAFDMYDDYLPDFLDDLHHNPQKVTEVSEEEAYRIINMDYLTKNKVNEECKRKIVEIADKFYKENAKKALKRDEEFIKYPHLFLLGCVMDSQINAKKAWAIPNIIAEELGGKDFSLFCQKDLTWYREQFENKKLHRFNKEMSDAFYSAVIKIKEEYNGDASNIWNDTPTSAELICRLLEFKKIGIKIATMAANLLCRDYGVVLKDKYAIEISPDVHVKRTMYRLGLLAKTKDVDFKSIDATKVIYAAKSLNPVFPGVLDYICWNIGNKKICTNSGCMSTQNNKCPFADFCIRQK